MLIIFTDSSFENDNVEIIGGANRGISTIQEAQEAVITHYETVLKPRIKASKIPLEEIQDVPESIKDEIREDYEESEPKSTLYLLYNNGDKIHRNIIARVFGAHYGDYILVGDGDIYTVDLKEEAKNESGEGSSTEEI